MTAKTDIQPGSTKAWILASRPATLTAAIVPVAVGSACAIAVSGFRLIPALAALLGAVFIQIGTNFANDVFDFEKGADTEERLGPIRATQAGLLSANQVRGGMMLSFALATLCGVYLVLVAGWPVIAIGVASILSGIAYTGGPYPLGYHGLGDLFVMIFFGFVAVCGTAYVQVGHVPTIAWWASIPVGSLATAILVVNNMRDRQTDAVCGKRTLAVRFGPQAAMLEYLTMMALAYLVPSFLHLSGQAGFFALLPLASMPVAAGRVRDLYRADAGPAYNDCLKRTAQLLLLHGGLFAVGLSL